MVDWCVGLAVISTVAAGPVAVAGERPAFDPEEVARILSHGPWPMAWSPDPSNRVSGKPAAAALGRRLFFDARLSRFGALSCSFCHKPEKAWGDGRVQASSVARLDRNTLPLYNVRQFRWFSWDGAADSLWMQSVRPLIDPRELAASPEHVRSVVAGDAKLAAAYRQVFGQRVSEGQPETALVNVAKAMAAFQETIVTGRTPFDDYRDALAAGDKHAMARYPAAAERGLKIFVGAGGCGRCHMGPLFTDGAFYDTGVRGMAGRQVSDPGRPGGLLKLESSAYNRLGSHSDNTTGALAAATRDAIAGRSDVRAFKVPSLRNAALTAPYMHDGSKATLADAVRHYRARDEGPPTVTGEKTGTSLQRIELAEQDIGDLVAFLESLTERTAKRGPSRRAPVAK